MEFPIQNPETGEVIYIPYDTLSVKQQRYDAETGEPDMGEVKVRYLKQQYFQIPKKYIRTPTAEQFERDVQECYQERSVKSQTKHGFMREDYINMEGVSNDIIMAYKKSNYRILLIPTLFCFKNYAALVIILIELIFHMWAHYYNILSMNRNIYYRSPLHALTSQFCCKCRYELEGKKIAYLNKMMHLDAQGCHTLRK